MGTGWAAGGTPGGRRRLGASAGETFGSLADVEGLEATEEREEDLEQVGDVDDAPVVRLVNAIMGEALHSRASDIHVEPQERDVRVRYRIDGLLREVTVVPKAIQGPLISRIKILSGMDISERRKPQDGRGRIKLERLEADTRVSSMPTMHGETVVIRLLRKETEKAKTLPRSAWTRATGWWWSGPSASRRA
jgi:type IV pilus assembly protein PilB